MKLKVLDLFSGIGGFSLGLERTGGFETVAFCEIEPYCQKVLAKHWPGVPIYDDVRELTADRLIRDGIRPTLLPEDSRARTFPLQERARELKVNDQGYGQSSVELLARYSPSSLSSRTSLPSFQEETQNTTQITAAYAAGLIDGEGCIYLMHNKKANTFTPRVDVGMTTKAEPIFKELEKVAGKVRETRKATKKWEAVKCWTVIGEEAVRFLMWIHGDLVMKKPQAEYCLALQMMLNKLPKHPNGMVMWDNKARKVAQKIKQEISSLNRKGPALTEQETIASLVEGRWFTNQADLDDQNGLTEFLETWPRSGMTRNGIAYQLPRLALTITEIGSGLLPTPTSSEGGRNKSASPNAAIRPSLGMMAKKNMWPTPDVKGFSNDGAIQMLSKKANSREEYFAMGHRASVRKKEKYWPTPISNEHKYAFKNSHIKRIESGKELHLAHLVNIYLTPTATDYKGSPSLEKVRKRSEQSSRGVRLPEHIAKTENIEVSGSLNPAFVEWLMGYPEGWTDLKDSGTQ